MGDRLEEIREREANATPGPWVRHSRDFREHRSHSVKALNGEGSVVSFEGYGPDGSCYTDAEFIAHAREDVPWLLDRLQFGQEAAVGLAIARDNAIDAADTWKAHAEADHAVLDRVAALVEEFRQAAAQADFVGFDSCWETAADKLAAALTGAGPADRD